MDYRCWEDNNVHIPGARGHNLSLLCWDYLHFSIRNPMINPSPCGCLVPYMENGSVALGESPGAQVVHRW